MRLIVSKDLFVHILHIAQIRVRNSDEELSALCEILLVEFTVVDVL